MGTIADKLNKLLGTKSAIRQAIVDMGQSVIGTASFSSYAAKIRAISSDATAAAGDILSGKTAYAGGKKITGTIPGRGAADLTASGAAVSVPAGHYPEAVSKSVATADQAAPDISVGSNGLITASVTQGAGYVAAGTRSATRQLATQAGTTITPGTSAKTAVAAGRYTTGAVTVAGDANLVAANIKSGVSIFGVAGALSVPIAIQITITNTLSASFVITYYNVEYCKNLNKTIPANSTATIIVAAMSTAVIQNVTALGMSWKIDMGNYGLEAFSDLNNSVIYFGSTSGTIRILAR